MKTLLKAFYVSACILYAAISGAQTFGNLVWSDEFNGSGAPDPSKWGYELGYVRNNELQYYTSSTNNVRQYAGNLEITVLKQKVRGTNYGKPQTFNYTSGSVITLNKASWKYGKIEGRIKMPKGKGLWACFWTLGANYPQVWWPKSGEIDIAEHINSETIIHSTAHWSDKTGVYRNSGGTGGGGSVTGNSSYTVDVTQWHVYSIEWTPYYIKWLVDGNNFFSMDITNSINGTDAFHLPQYLLINLPIGGDWPGPPDATTVLPATMYCDYIRVYAYNTTTVPVTGVAVSPSTASVNVGVTTQLTATVAPTDATNKTVTWSSGNASIATVTSTGLVTGIATGTVTIQATSAADGTKLGTATITVTPVPSNIALGKPVTVSTTDGSYAGSLAVDGNLSTRWGSAYADPQWIYVDLGANYNISRVKIAWEYAYGKDYLVQFSTDAINWATIKTITGNTSLNVDYTGLSGTARYVRMYGTARGSVYGYSMYELEVYGTLSSIPTANLLVSSTSAKSASLNKQSTCRLYPNPATGVVHITGNLKQVTCFDSNGKLVISKTLNNLDTNNALDISSLHAGVYLLRLQQTDGNVITRNLLVGNK